jgi:all-trans-retinol 13,14-reductase
VTRSSSNYLVLEIYGLDHNPKWFRQTFLKPRVAIKNFYLTGQDIATTGIGSTLFSRGLTAMAITGKNVLKKVQQMR